MPERARKQAFDMTQKAAVYSAPLYVADKGTVAEQFME